MVLSATTWGVMIGSIIVLWGTAIWSLYRTLRDAGRKIKLINKQDKIDTYSPRSLTELGEWIQSNPTHPFTEEARQRYNECVENLHQIDETFYDWDESEIQSLEKL